MDFSRRSFHRSSSSSTQISGPVVRKGTMHNIYAPSVYGGAGGQGIRISSTSHVTNSGGRLSGDFSVGNEKITMQNLNDRLASYLEKVHSLEQSNSHLEIQIRKWYEKNSPTLSRDYSAYFKTIEDLQNKIKDAQLANALCVLQLDNSKLAVEDFRIKYETEHGMRLSVEADSQRLRKLFDDLTLQKTGLEIQIESLTEELAFLKKAHEEDIANLRGQLGKTVNVEVDAAPGHDLATIMNEMRQKYELMAQKNLQEAKEQFEKRIEDLQVVVRVSTDEIKNNEAQVTELRRNYQNIEIELQSQYSMKESLERALEETEARYGSRLAQIQALISAIEAQLIQVRSDTERQNEEYNFLLDVKTRLEMEIATYRRLLEGEDVSFPPHSPPRSPPHSHSRSPPRSPPHSHSRSPPRSPPHSHSRSPPRSPPHSHSRSPPRSPPHSPRQSPPRSPPQSRPKPRPMYGKQHNPVREAKTFVDAIRTMKAAVDEKFTPSQTKKIKESV